MFDVNPAPSSAPVACNPSAIPHDQRPRWIEITKHVYGAVKEVQETADGYAYRLPGDAQTLRDVAEYVSRDRHCCAFLRWTIRVEPEQGDVWLITTGSPAAKNLLREGFETTDLIPLAVAREGGFDVSRRVVANDSSVAQITHQVNAAARR